MRQVGTIGGLDRRAQEAPRPHHDMLHRDPPTLDAPRTSEIPQFLSRRARALPRLPQRRRSGPGRARIILPLALIALLGGGLAFSSLAISWLTMRPADAAQSATGSIDRIAATLGLGIDQVSVTGHRHALDSDILDALELQSAASFLSFDTAAARRRVEDLPWIETAEIARIFPGQLAIKVTERRPYAVWRRGDRSWLVDVGGRVLSPVRPSQPDGLASGLARIAGDGAATEAASLHATLARYPQVLSRLTEAERVGARRWRLHLAGNVTLELPADREALVLETLESGGTLSRLLSASDHVVDLRAPGRIAVRPAGIGALAAGLAAGPARASPGEAAP